MHLVRKQLDEDGQRDAKLQQLVLVVGIASDFLLTKWVPPRLGPYMIEPTRLCPHTFVPTHDCAQTRLCPHTFVPTHVCALACYTRVVTITASTNVSECARILHWIRDKISTNSVQYIPNSSISLYSFTIWRVKIVREARKHLVKRLEDLRVGTRCRPSKGRRCIPDVDI